MFVFLHMPKTGGFAFRFLLIAKNGDDQILDIVNEKQMADYLGSSPRKTYRALCGHMPYGVHRHVSDPCQYYVMLREPVDRVISDYYYIARSPQHPLYEQIQHGLTLLEYARRPQHHDRQTIHLSHYDLTKLGPKDPLWFNQNTGPMEFSAAKETLLERIDMLGIYEHFIESAQAFCDMIDFVPPPQIPFYNVSPERPKVEALDPAVRSAIAECNPYDTELYELALRQFQRDPAVRKAIARTKSRMAARDEQPAEVDPAETGALEV